MSNTQSRIQEQIERVAAVGSLEYKLLLRGAEIALENQWIRVEDKLPEILQEVSLLCKGGYVEYAIRAYNGQCFRLTDVYGADPLEYTQWMPKPTPPKP